MRSIIFILFFLNTSYALEETESNQITFDEIAVSIDSKNYLFVKSKNNVWVSQNCGLKSCDLIRKIESFPSKDISTFSAEGKNPSAIFCMKYLKGNIITGEILNVDEKIKPIYLCHALNSYIEIDGLFKFIK